MIGLYVRGYFLKEKALEMLKDESGMGVIEIAIIIIVLIGIALVFKTQISNFVDGLMTKIKTQLDTI